MKPIPWFWVTRLLISSAACVLWGLTHPNVPLWQLFIVGFVVAAAVEGLRWGYRREQDEIRDRK